MGETEKGPSAIKVRPTGLSLSFIKKRGLSAAIPYGVASKITSAGRSTMLWFYSEFQKMFKNPHQYNFTRL